MATAQRGRDLASRVGWRRTAVQFGTALLSRVRSTTVHGMADDVAGEIADKAVLDAALINAAQAAEHYEITRYGSLIAWARQLGRNDCASILQQTLDEEKKTDAKLTSLAEGKVNLRAAS